ncbi:hypothetical protein OVY29_18115 [Sphingopyxis sp. SE2]|uniref:hypothetical protein n=1 Tax=Sphingopyxis sp. SE2 TaxID=1586240 RepID=UPI0028BF870D|nr:hypothetical protein [Sphingopyxis sp. SE2]MDT7530580.1 hypothetical protein [Sphingopyxis sp. SE2]
MSAPPPLERVLLAKADKILAHGSSSAPTEQFAQRLEILDAAAALIGGFDLAKYREKCVLSEPRLTVAEASTLAQPVLAEIARTRIPHALALSALAREPLSKHETRIAGAHYTDFRLALLIGQMSAELNSRGDQILDPASGAGMLLAAASIAACERGHAPARWLAEKVIAADQSSNALRGAQLSLASLTDDVAAITEMSSRWLHGDSLLRTQSEWRAAIDGTLGVIVANPPWEKLKVLRHEQEVAAGADRHYGAAHSQEPGVALQEERLRMREYTEAIVARYPLAGRGETDLFVAFTQMMVELTDGQAGIAALLPAGLIRSKSTTEVRKLLLDQFGQVSFTVLDNKQRFFEIDTRFKFVAMTADQRRSNANSAVRIGYGEATGSACERGPFSSIDRKTLEQIRPDLSIPEVRSVAEWELFQRMAEAGQRWSEPTSPWWPHLMREVDMTRERHAFRDYPVANAVPLVEGRMVHQFRFGAKSYLEGSGRRAIWTPVPLGVTSIEPQFWIGKSDIPKSAAKRVDTVRAGFCDIAGQTNERSMMAAVIPAGVVCGNKVPTVSFPNLPGTEALDLWCGMVNSFAFDWMLRRVLTTTVNYFLLQSVPLPPLRPFELPGRGVAMDARQVAALSASGGTDSAMAIAELRRNIDLACFRAYGISTDEIALILSDFPSLDRSEPALAGERRSTVTRDFILSAVESAAQNTFAQRVETAIKLGARPYRPSQSANIENNAVQPLRAAT